jgi:hypothetical protein
MMGLIQSGNTLSIGMSCPLLPTAGNSQMKVNHKVKVFPPSDSIFLAQQTCYEDWGYREFGI